LNKYINPEQIPRMESLKKKNQPRSVPRRVFLRESAIVGLIGCIGTAGCSRSRSSRKGSSKRMALAEPGPMIPPVPAILLTVNGMPGNPEEISVLWTFVVNGKPPQVGVSAEHAHVAGNLIREHGEFVLNVPTVDIVDAFDIVDMNSSQVSDKFALSGLTRGRAVKIDAPTVEESPIQLECRVFNIIDVPPMRTVFLADVVATTVHEHVCDEDGRLMVPNVPFFGMTAGSGEFYTMGKAVGHIGMSVGRDDIKY
jgi:flavin reductase (DIM6/NTAB) family NADH-FMN oxidoreductase RutF